MTLSTITKAPLNGVDNDAEACSKLSKVLQENHVYLGGSSMGKGFVRAARHYLQQQASNQIMIKNRPAYFDSEEARADLNDDIVNNPVEDSFYVVDLGVIVSQYYQWRKAFPRVEPFYAVKCNPDPVIVRTLAILGANFDCASRAEIRLVHEVSKDLTRQPDIVYANPCKARAHLIEAVCTGVKLVTFDNAMEVAKCAAVSKKIKLIMRIVTDDRGSVCRLSSKFGAHKNMWRINLAAAKKHGLEVVGVSFHVGSGCRDASRYELALNDAKDIFEMAARDFGFKMSILDIGGGFPGESHSIWNPVHHLDDDADAEAANGITNDDDVDSKAEEDDESDEPLMFFSDIAEKVRPMIDELFPEESGVRLIAEPGRYFVAASATLVASVVSKRNNLVDESEDAELKLQPVDNFEASICLDQLTREEERQMVKVPHSRRSTFGQSMDFANDSGTGDVVGLFDAIGEELAEYQKMFTMQSLAQQEADVYNDGLDLAREGYDTARDLLGPPIGDDQMANKMHSVEGMNAALVSDVMGEEGEAEGNLESALNLMVTSAGEAAVQGVVMHAVADHAVANGQDDFAYYINDGVYGAFNNIMFDHACIRPRQLKNPFGVKRDSMVTINDGANAPEPDSGRLSPTQNDGNSKATNTLYASTVFGPTCDSIDVIARSALLPRLEVGDWLYFQNMGAYTNAAASSFNGFSPSERFYVCSVLPEYFEDMIAGPAGEGGEANDGEEKKEEA
jgi:ornithine decarboxylase